jgi:hypothetical protein
MGVRSFILQLPQMYKYVNSVYLQHDIAPPHFSRQLADFLHGTYPDRCIGIGVPVAWPPRSPDLNPLDFYIWGHMKPLIYEKTNNRDALVPKVLDTAEQIQNTTDVPERTISLLPQRATQCIAADGAQSEYLLWI